MQTGQPSRTALAAARYRAAHQILDDGRIFSDPLAVKILGEDAEGTGEETGNTRRRMRVFIAVRTRFAEDKLAQAVEGGAKQLVVLGAGLDTYAYRGADRVRLRIFEVDHPDTQAWKRGLLQQAGIAIPGNLSFAPVDFERETLAGGLAAAGFDATVQTFFTWLGVVPYLTADAIRATLGYISGLPGGAHVVFDYGNPPESLPPEWQAGHAARAARVAELGEAFRSYYTREEMRAMLEMLSFSTVEDLGPREFAARYFPHRAGTAPESGGHIVHAATV